MLEILNRSSTSPQFWRRYRSWFSDLFKNNISLENLKYRLSYLQWTWDIFPKLIFNSIILLKHCLMPVNRWLIQWLITSNTAVICSKAWTLTSEHESYARANRSNQINEQDFANLAALGWKIMSLFLTFITTRHSSDKVHICSSLDTDFMLQDKSTNSDFPLIGSKRILHLSLTGDSANI